jgi:hypothetical protein
VCFFFAVFPRGGGGAILQKISKHKIVKTPEKTPACFFSLIKVGARRVTARLFNWIVVVACLGRGFPFKVFCRRENRFYFTFTFIFS